MGEKKYSKLDTKKGAPVENWRYRSILKFKLRNKFKSETFDLALNGHNLTFGAFQNYYFWQINTILTFRGRIGSISTAK